VAVGASVGAGKVFVLTAVGVLLLQPVRIITNMTINISKSFFIFPPYELLDLNNIAQLR